MLAAGGRSAFLRGDSVRIGQLYCNVVVYEDVLNEFCVDLFSALLLRIPFCISAMLVCLLNFVARCACSQFVASFTDDSHAVCRCMRVNVGQEDQFLILYVVSADDFLEHGLTVFL